MDVHGLSAPNASAYYNKCKKESPQIPGLGRPQHTAGVRKLNNTDSFITEVDDDDCFTVLEILSSPDDVQTVGRCYSFVLQGDASECFDAKSETWNKSKWVMIRGLGPNHGDVYKLSKTEELIKETISI